MKYVALLVILFLSIAGEIPALNIYRQQEIARQTNVRDAILTEIARRFTKTPTPSYTRTFDVRFTASPTPRVTATSTPRTTP